MNLRHLPTLKEREERYIRRVLQLCGFNVEDAARVLGLGRATAYRKVRELGPIHTLRPQPERPQHLICPMCGDWAKAPVRDDAGQLTWDCRGGCNP